MTPAIEDAASRPTAIRFQAVSRMFGPVKAVDRVDLAIDAGEFFAILGPSGSGKTTCLRLIAGFDQPSDGHIEIFGETAEGVPPYRRAVNTVFQDYALFPHMTVGENVAYGLRIRGIGKAERTRLAAAALDLVRLPGFSTRKPAQLSGGQRQRVALARALVLKPKALLLDEPLGALDLKLREDMQVELKALQRKLGLTFVLVTHDQGEALSMADRLAVFHQGKVAQIGSPQDIYDRPRTRFVADFVGSANIVPAAALEPLRLTGVLASGQVEASLRPERIRVTPARGLDPALSDRPAFQVVVEDVLFQGPTRRVIARHGADASAASLRLTASGDARDLMPCRVGDTVSFAFEAGALHPLEAA